MATQSINHRQRKFLLVLPVLVLPFIALLFWAMGGGRQKEQATSRLAGLNMQLPAAKLKDDSADNKLSIYQQAEKDSLKFKQAQKDDPYYKADPAHGPDEQRDSLQRYDTGIANRPVSTAASPIFAGRSLNTAANNLRSNEQQINQKLELLNRQINQPAPADIGKTENGTNEAAPGQLRDNAAAINTAGSEDPQMAQLSNMLDKIQEIQNPGLVQRKLREQSEKNRGQVFAVSTFKKENTVSDFGGTESLFQFNSQSNGFYSFDNSTAASSQNAIEAVIHESKTVVNGSTVKLRLVNDVFINGVLIPKDNFVFGLAALNGDRLTIKISSIHYQHSIFPVDLSVYDIDGVSGIYIPGAISRDVAKESADQSIQNIGFSSYDPSLGAQAATAGITAAKSLFSRKVRLVKVTVKAGYQVLLRDEKQKQTN
ncbi:conjugative transposon protein TraM [Mucilaginibacter mali]|uniref:Conjugative transposon protein TraM n=1 Tax=Mucilaginibacter mali TaxID=2740462 RepID=A0A7D4UPD3_9SPHI|nr:conjugative transposon protein TraM [Mucilaginibacter mali]QKJ30300.1 conjugative transposon protein TraM [Mucilaginibacter mali]